MAAQYLESREELIKTIKECAKDDVLVVVFDSSRSSKCKDNLSSLEKLEAKSQALKIVFLDIEKQANAVLASQMRLRTVPTMLVFKGGETVDQAEGLLDEDSLDPSLSSSR